MSQSVRVAIKDHFSELTDPRRREVIYPLINVVTIAVCAVVCGADDFVAIAAWGRTKQEWLAKFLDLSRGIPSHDRFNAIFAAIKPAEFEKCLLSWISDGGGCFRVSGMSNASPILQRLKVTDDGSLRFAKRLPPRCRHSRNARERSHRWLKGIHHNRSMFV